MRRIAVLVLLLWMMVVTLVLAVSTPIDDDITTHVDQDGFTSSSIEGVIRSTTEELTVEVFKVDTIDDRKLNKLDVDMKNKGKGNDENDIEKEPELDVVPIKNDNKSKDEDEDDEDDQSDEYEDDYYYWEDSLSKDGINKYMDSDNLLTNHFFDGWDDYEDGSAGEDYSKEEEVKTGQGTGRIIRLPWEKKRR